MGSFEGIVSSAVVEDSRREGEVLQLFGKYFEVFIGQILDHVKHLIGIWQAIEASIWCQNGTRKSKAGKRLTVC